MYSALCFLLYDACLNFSICRREYAHNQFTSSFLKTLIDLKHDDRILFALQLVQLQLKRFLTSLGMEAGCNFCWSFYTVTVFLFCYCLNGWSSYQETDAFWNYESLKKKRKKTDQLSLSSDLSASCVVLSESHAEGTSEVMLKAYQNVLFSPLETLWRSILLQSFFFFFFSA